MKNYYYGLNQAGAWIWFYTKKHIRNCKAASEICGEQITSFRLVPLWKIPFLKKEFKRGN